MKMLLTSQMICNKTIADALLGLLGKPFSESRVSYVVTSHNAADGDKSWFAENVRGLYDLGWKNFYMIDVAGADGLDKSAWLRQIESSDVIVMGGGKNYFLSYWLEKSGLLEILPKLLENKVYVGASAGSMLTQPNLHTSSQAMESFSKGRWDVNFAELGPRGLSSDKTLNLIDFLIRPHYGSEDKEFVTDELIQAVADHFGRPIYALDDDTAIVVADGQVEVASEGKWKLFN